MTGVEKLIEVAGGSPSALAAKLTDSGHKCSRQLVEYWADRGYVTPRWAQIIHSHFGIPLHDLNPTIYPESLS
jgi:hypothetical protein